MPSKSRRRPVATDKRFRKRSEPADYGPQERWQHSGRTLELTEKAGLLAARATEEHIIDIMVMRNFLTKTQSEAAFKFKLDYQRAALGSHVTGSYNPHRANVDFVYGSRVRSDYEEAAYRRWRNAVRRLGMRLSGPVIATVCHDLLPMPRDIPFLQTGLEVLAVWYHLPKDTTVTPLKRS